MLNFQQEDMQYSSIPVLSASGTVTDYGIVYIIKHTE